VASVAAIVSHKYTYELVRAYAESGLTARLLPFTVDRQICAASTMVLDANRCLPRLALWSPDAGIVATVDANLVHGLGHWPVGALVSAWPAVALVGSFELLILFVRSASGTHLVVSADYRAPVIELPPAPRPRDLC
jgi:hypothetical protein